MKQKVLIIGSNSFISKNLFSFFVSKKINVKKISFESFKKKKKLYAKNFDIFINCSIKKNYVNKKYKTINDNDLFLAKELKNNNKFQILLSTRKVYKEKINIKETDITEPRCNYSRNKIESEKKIFKILENKLLILRVSNVIGYPVKNNRKIHKTFLDTFFENIKKGIIYDNKSIFKDFISAKRLSKIIYLLISKRAYGVYNVSINKKIYLNELIDWLNFYNKNKVLTKIKKNNLKNKSFTLNNNKLINKIKVSYSINDLKKECLKISKKYFK